MNISPALASDVRSVFPPATLRLLQAALVPPVCSLPLGIVTLDAALAGGLARSAVHDIFPGRPLHPGAAAGFAAVLAGKAQAAQRGDIVWIQSVFSRSECGRLHAAGMEAFGLAAGRLTVICVPRDADVLWCMEEALACRTLAAVVGECGHAGIDLTSSRRLSLAARSGGLGILLHGAPGGQASAAATRWQVCGSPSRPDPLGGLGRPVFDLSLLKNRHGRCGRWTIAWDVHERAFVTALPLGLAATAFDRPDRALGAGAR
jgi:protein ImuA